MCICFFFFFFLTLLSWDKGQEVEAHLSLDLAEDTDKYLVNIYEIYKVVLQCLVKRKPTLIEQLMCLRFLNLLSHLVFNAMIKYIDPNP